ncbi:unnamed protein product [Nezara viridula]|uniref:Peptidase S1 domain-containing protein n=1 Tax=Nezara viridula TaxID=85310 RepID=A0A9P0MUV4_NEZVI|nr:unnamed protein product [Nezara viridula]
MTPAKRLAAVLNHKGKPQRVNGLALLLMKATQASHQRNPYEEHEEDSIEEGHPHPEFHSARRESSTSPGTLWRMPTSPIYDDFVASFSGPNRPDNKNKEHKREDTMRYTTERWRSSEYSSGTRVKDERDVLFQRQTSTSFPQRAKTTKREPFGNEVERDSLEGMDGGVADMRKNVRRDEQLETTYPQELWEAVLHSLKNILTCTRDKANRFLCRRETQQLLSTIGPMILVASSHQLCLFLDLFIPIGLLFTGSSCARGLFTGARTGAARWVLLGELDISTTEDDARPQEKEIVERLKYPNYQEPATYHDIALFKMDSDVIFTSWVAPACLHFSRNIHSSIATVTGWGRTGFVSEISNALLEVDLNIFNDTLCTSTVNKLAGPKMPRGYDAATMICAGHIAGGKDACQGDSGGPLVITDDSCIKTQIGITSIGSDCGLPNSPGIYTRVSEYVSWIEGIVWS